MAPPRSELKQRLLDESFEGDELDELGTFSADSIAGKADKDDEDAALLAQLSTISEQPSSCAHSVVSASSLWAGGNADMDSGGANTNSDVDGDAGLAPDGVHIEVLRRLVSQAAPGASTADVCRDVVLPQTAEGRCALLDQLRGQCAPDGAPLVAPATVFVSHSWRFDFALTAGVCEDVAAQLEAERRTGGTATARSARRWRRHHRVRRHDRQRQGPAGPSYFWLDLVVNSQHGTATRPFEWWCTTFTQSIGRIGHVALVLAPWDDPVPLTRAWCLWEIFSAFVSDARLTIHVPKAQQSAFLRTLVERPSAVAEVLTNVNAERAEATNPTDRDMIFAAIQAERGFGRINLTIKEQLRVWLVDECVDHCMALQQQTEPDGAEKNLGEQGDPSATVGRDNSVAGHDATASLLAANTCPVDRARFFRHTADLLREFGFLNKALEWYDAGLRTIRLGQEGVSDVASDPGTLLRAELEVGRGTVLCDSGQLEKGLERVRQGTADLRILAEADPAAAHVLTWATLELAAAHVSAHSPSQAHSLLTSVLGRTSFAAEALLQVCLDDIGAHNAASQGEHGGSGSRMGSVDANAGRHHERWIPLALLARALQLQSETETQLRHYQAALSLTKLALRAQSALGGQRSPAMGRLHCRAGRTCSMAGQYTLAFEHLATSESIVTELLGASHPEMGQILREHARAHLKLKESAKALSMARQAATLQSQTLGPHHIETAKSVLVLACLHSARHETKSDKKALHMLRSVGRVLEQNLGASHGLVRVARMELNIVDTRMQLLAHRRPFEALCSGTLCLSWNALMTCCRDTVPFLASYLICVRRREGSGAFDRAVD